MMDLAAARRQAEQYLAEALGPRAPGALQPQGEFDEAPLEGEARTWLFSFELPAPAIPEASGPPATAICANRPTRHYVAAGQTEPNYFPAYDLSPDEAYSFHVGTRFMLEMQVQIVDASLEPPGARDALHAFVREYARGAALEAEALAGLFRCEDAYFAVYRLRLDGQDVYCLGADCPPGFYFLTQYPPQMVLRLHLGNVIRAEARRAANGANPPAPDAQRE